MIGISTKIIYADEVLKIKEIAARASVPQSFMEQILLEYQMKANHTLNYSILGRYCNEKRS